MGFFLDFSLGQLADLPLLLLKHNIYCPSISSSWDVFIKGITQYYSQRGHVEPRAIYYFTAFSS